MGQYARVHAHAGKHVADKTPSVLLPLGVPTMITLIILPDRSLGLFLSKIDTGFGACGSCNVRCANYGETGTHKPA